MAHGHTVAQVPPFWEVVERAREGGGFEHVVVDVKPRRLGRVPVKVYGPASREECVVWAESEALFLTVGGGPIRGE